MGLVLFACADFFLSAEISTSLTVPVHERISDSEVINYRSGANSDPEEV